MEILRQRKELAVAKMAGYTKFRLKAKYAQAEEER